MRQIAAEMGHGQHIEINVLDKQQIRVKLPTGFEVFFYALWALRGALYCSVISDLRVFVHTSWIHDYGRRGPDGGPDRALEVFFFVVK
jgi:hypothetical protein